jgi:hypothetical protein
MSVWVRWWSTRTQAERNPSTGYAHDRFLHRRSGLVWRWLLLKRAGPGAECLHGDRNTCSGSSWDWYHFLCPKELCPLAIAAGSRSEPMPWHLLSRTLDCPNRGRNVRLTGNTF